MDTSETYIKMCKGAVKYLKPFMQYEIDSPVRRGSGVFARKRTRETICTSIEEHRFLRNNDKYCSECGAVSKRILERDIYIDYNQWEDSVWLPTQSQLQEMVGGFPEVFERFADSVGRNAFDYGQEEMFDYELHATTCTSMEQLWLAFVMWELHQKKWNDGWVLDSGCKI